MVAFSAINANAQISATWFILSINHWRMREGHLPRKMRLFAPSPSRFFFLSKNQAVDFKSNELLSVDFHCSSHEARRSETMRDEGGIRFSKLSGRVTRHVIRNTRCATRALTANDPRPIILTIVKDKLNNSHGEQTIYGTCGPRLAAQRAAISRRLATLCIYHDHLRSE